MARPKLDIDAIEVQKLAALGATNCEIANFFGCDEATIRARFPENLIKGRANMKLRLRQLQWKAAEKGNITMLIWLGKQELGQVDKVEQKIEDTRANDLVPSMTKAQAKELLIKAIENDFKPEPKKDENSSDK